MAVIKAVSSKASLGKAINYIKQEEKSEEKLVSGINCNPNTAIEQMKYTKAHYKKTEGRQYKHYVQSFSPDEKNLTYEKAHEIGREWAKKNFKGYEVVVATHQDRNHIHNHFIINSVNYETGKKYNEPKNRLAELKKDSDRICEREGLSVIKEKTKTITSYTHKKYKVLEKAVQGKEKSYVLDTARDVSSALKKSKTKEEFIGEMNKKGYEVNWKDNRKNITYTDKDGNKVRSSNLVKTFKEDKFSKEGMSNEFQRNRERARGNEKIDGGTKSTNTRINTNADRNNGVTQTNARLHQSTLGRRNDKKDISTRGNESIARPNERYKGTDKDLIEQAKRDIARREQENRDGVKHIINGNERNEQASISENVADREYDKSTVIEDRPEHKRENGKHKTRDKYRGR